MDKLILTIYLCFISFSAFAGPELESFKASITAYLKEQSKTPNHIINYTDKNGSVARLLLNPARVDLVISEISGEINQTATTKALMDLYVPAAKNYERAFSELPGRYDAEYLDGTDSMYRLLIFSVKPIQSMDLTQVKDNNSREMLEGVKKMANSLSGLLLSSIEQQIKTNKFSPEFTPIATARLEALKRLQSTMASPAATSSEAVPVPQSDSPIQNEVPAQKDSITRRVFVSTTIGKGAFIELSQDVNEITEVTLPKSGFKIMTLPSLGNITALQVCASNSRKPILDLNPGLPIKDGTCFGGGTGMAMRIATPPNNEVPLIISDGSAHNYYTSDRRVDETARSTVNVNSAYAIGGATMGKTYLLIYIDKNQDHIMSKDELWFAKVTWE